QNIVYADIGGNIGFIAPARIPIRAAGDGWLPSPGWSGEHDWVGTVGFDALLDATPRQSPDASAAIQADDLSLAAKTLLPLMLAIAPKDDDARAAIAR